MVAEAVGGDAVHPRRPQCLEHPRQGEQLEHADHGQVDAVLAQQDGQRMGEQARRQALRAVQAGQQDQGRGVRSGKLAVLAGRRHGCALRRPAGGQGDGGIGPFFTVDRNSPLRGPGLHVEQEEWAGRLDFSAHGVGGFHKVPPNVPPIYSDRDERLRTVGAEFISKSGLRSEFPQPRHFTQRLLAPPSRNPSNGHAEHRQLRHLR